MIKIWRDSLEGFLNYGCVLRWFVFSQIFSAPSGRVCADNVTVKALEFRNGSDAIMRTFLCCAVLCTTDVHNDMCVFCISLHHFIPMLLPFVERSFFSSRPRDWLRRMSLK